MISHPITWLLAGLFVLLLPGTAPVVPSSRSPGGHRPPPVAAIAAVGLGAAAIVVFGLPVGLVTAGVLAPLAVLGTRLLPARRSPVRADRPLALALDLAAAALRSGRTVGDALAAAAPAVPSPTRDELMRVAALLRLGARADQAWSLSRVGPLQAVATAAVRSSDSGIKLAAAWERSAVEIRAECASHARMRAERAGVRAMGPLAACFLPSFVCLGIVPVIIGIARTSLGVLG